MSFEHLCGWVEDKNEVEKTLSRMTKPYMSVCDGAIRDTGKGKVQLLYKALELVNNGVYPTLTQAIGDCVSFGGAGALDTLKAVEIVMKGEYETFQTITATEYLYYVSRILIGKGSLGESDGSVGSWLVEGLKTYGALLRKKYGDIDLSVYSGQRAKQYGSPRQGAPKELVKFGQEHKIQTYTQVNSYEEVRDAVYNLYPVIICSGQGFTSQTDSEGFLRAQGSWGHCMFIHAVDDQPKRPGCCIQNSWGSTWVSGPKKLENPAGSFWADAGVIDRIVKQGDSWAISNFQGYPQQDINWSVAEKAKQKLKDFDGVEK